MKKSVLASIKPKFCELIASGKKTVEIRKNRPKIDVPFKCYIYQSKGNWIYKILEWLGLYQQKVIGEFVCDDIDEVVVHYDILYCVNNKQANKLNKLKQACLTIEDVKAYLGIKNRGYAWHISNLVIYDKPKELSEFRLTRPPQSWCYVEELEG